MRPVRALFLLLLCLLLSCLSASVAAADPIDGTADPGIWWDQTPDYTEVATPPYPSYTYYSQLPAILHDIDVRSDRVSVEVMGHSALGRDLFLVTVSDPTGMKDLGGYRSFRDLMLSDPAKAQAQLAAGKDVKVPVFINASIHGDETPGVDGALRLLRRLAFDNDPETMAILKNEIVLIDICQNPDGRIADRRENGNGFDCNRDFLTLSQPESRATATQIAKWKPMVLLDLHGYYNPLYIEPCTPPHNPNYEYDLFSKWGIQEALAMRAAVESNTNHNVTIPALDVKAGFEDYTPIYTPQFAMYYGTLAFTVETCGESEDGVACDYWAQMGALDYAVAHKSAMFSDQIEVFKRGIESYVQPDIVFPYAHVIPAAAPLQKSPLQAAKAIERLQFCGIQVQRATSAFTAGGTTYPAGTYVVRMNQPLRALANTMLWDGQDLTNVTNKMYDICAWNLPEVWGFDSVAVAAPFSASLTPATTTAWPAGSVAGAGPLYALKYDSNNAVRAVNELLAGGAKVQVTTRATGSGAAALPAGTMIVDGRTAALADVAMKNRVKFTAVAAPPAAAVKTLHQPKIASCGSPEQFFVLRQLGFNVSTVSSTGSLAGYDVVVGSNDYLSASALKSYVSAGGGYVGVGSHGTSGPLGNMLKATVAWSVGSYDNAVVKAQFRPEGLVGAYFKADDNAFCFRPVWFSSVGAGVNIDAWYGGSGFFMAGYWKDAAMAMGAPAVIDGTYGQGKVVYIGFDPVFRAYPDGTFRLVANSIWAAMK